MELDIPITTTSCNPMLLVIANFWQVSAVLKQRVDIVEDPEILEDTR